MTKSEIKVELRRCAMTHDPREEINGDALRELLDWRWSGEYISLMRDNLSLFFLLVAEAL